MASEPRFIVDVNVGRLAKWLRILGFDTLFVNPIDDGVLVELARQEGRIVLTKDTRIPERRPVASGQVRVLVVEGERASEQLRFVASELGLREPFNLFSRCLECNVLLEAADRSLIEDSVPPYVYRTQDRYVTCPRCRKIYWRGTHWARMHRTVHDMLSPEGT
jgi:uncharacterized protein